MIKLEIKQVPYSIIFKIKKKNEIEIVVLALRYKFGHELTTGVHRSKAQARYIDTSDTGPIFYLSKITIVYRESHYTIREGKTTMTSPRQRLFVAVWRINKLTRLIGFT